MEGRRGSRELVFTGSGDRWILRVALLVLVVGFGWELTKPSVTPRSSDIPFIVGMSLLGWLMFQASFRTRLVAGAGSFTVVNFVTTHRVPYREVDEIMLDWLSVRFTLTDGRRVRAWAVPESYLSARGDRGEQLVQRLGAIVERRKDCPSVDETYRRRYSVDWWAFAVLLVLFATAGYVGGAR